MLGKWIGPACAAMLAWSAPAAAMSSQNPVDRADPSVVQRELRQERLPAPARPKPFIAEPVQRANSGLEGSVTIGGVRVEGATALQPSAFANVIDNYAGRTLSPDDLRALASELANVAREAGYGLATTWIPPQRIVNGLLRVRIDEGRIDAVETKGSGGAIVRRFLARLTDGKPVRTAALERQLLLAGDVAGIWVGKARLDRRGTRNILVVDTRRTAAEARVSLDNWGTSAVGPVRAQFAADFHGILSSGDRATIGGGVTPFEPEEFRLVRLGYTKAVGTRGTELNLGGYFARSRAGGSLESLDYDGRSWEVSAGVEHPLLRTRAKSVWAGIVASLRDSDQSRANVRIRDDRLATVTADGTGFFRLGNGRVRGRLAVVQGVGAFDATRGGDPLASRDDGSAVFTKVEMWSQYAVPLGERFALQLEAQGQLASRPLLSSEEMGLGGRTFLRGYDYREFAGDKGLAGSAELRFDLADMPAPIKSAQLYAYADAGSVGNYRGGGGGGSLASVGGGVRVRLGAVEAGLGLGIPLAKGYAGRERNPRLSFTLGARF